MTMTKSCNFALMLLAITTWVGSYPAHAQQPAPGEVIERRGAGAATQGEARKTVAGLEMLAPIPWATFLKAKDGRLMMIGTGAVSYSSDEGRTWSKPEKLSVNVDYAIRLQSGLLAGPVAAEGNSPDMGGRGSIFLYVSADEGKTWEKRGQILQQEKWLVLGGLHSYPNTLIQTKSGRLILPMRYTFGGHPGMYELTRGWGLVNGKLSGIEGHGHLAEIDIAEARYSDDEGKTWQRSDGNIMVWHKEGYGGMFSCDEPSVVEGRNGDVVMFCRTQLGRVYTARSQAENALQVDYFPKFRIYRKDFTPGERFDDPQPSVLSGSFSPCAIRRVPKTGDWLIVWNQVSGDEMRAGHRRGRLSSAISQDDGRTWQHYRTIDVAGLPPAGRVEPDPEPKMSRSLDYVGELPDDYGGVDYPSLDIIDDTVFLTYTRAQVTPKPGDVTGKLLRVVPLSWFYGEEPAPPASPRLLLKMPAEHGEGFVYREIPARYFNGRFYCHLQDVARYLKSPVGRLGVNMYAPINQVITCLGWKLVYDDSQMKDPKDPRMIVTATLAGAPAAK